MTPTGTAIFYLVSATLLAGCMSSSRPPDPWGQDASIRPAIASGPTLQGFVADRPFRARSAILVRQSGHNSTIHVFEHPVSCGDPRLRSTVGGQLTPGEREVAFWFQFDWPAEPGSIWTTNRNSGLDISFYTRTTESSRYMADGTVKVLAASGSRGILSVDAHSTRATGGIDGSVSGNVPFEECP